MINLNDMQRLGVLTTHGPVLILAGAGSGKTRVLTERIAHMIKDEGISPFNIMAITFTNKAANEMRERVDKSVGVSANDVWVATFHSSCVRILRRHADLLGYKSGFSIYDSDDSKSVMREVLKRLNIDHKKYPEKLFLNKISSAKNELLSPTKLAGLAGGNPDDMRVATVYKAYQERLFEQNAFDFDDLIMKTVELFVSFPQVLSQYQDRLQYIMVDEYQDTNTAQFELVRLLSDSHHNLCVVGDDDQSIYKFRGANIMNILNFETHFPEAKVIRLEQNYRSTTCILDAANSVIANNTGRKPKSLWTENGQGELINIKQFDTAYEEADFIAFDIASKVRSGKAKYNDCAILYRTNMQSRILEEKLLLKNLPYRIVGGTNFYSRMEIKDILAYLKTIDNALDDLAVSRIINVPKRGIGATSISRFADYATSNKITFFDALLAADDIPEVKRAAGKIKPFTDLIINLRNEANNLNVPQLMEKVITDSGYADALNAEGTDEAKGRLENLGELINKAVYYDREHPDGSLEGFLEEVALISDIDNTSDSDDRILLMTLHSAKGLEFDNVYMAGMEDGLFPGNMTIMSNDNAEMEEERRLCYVGITRAKRLLTMTAARARMTRGETEYHPISRFIKEITPELTKSDVFEEKRYEPIPSLPNTKSYKNPTANKTFDYDKKLKEITTGRQMEKSRPNYNEGDRVKHIKFGEGTVHVISDGGRDFEVTVDFDNHGIKKMFASFARLEKI